MNTNNIINKVLGKIKPVAAEQQRMQEVANRIISLVDRTAAGTGLKNVSGMLVGSAARGTWISGEHDLDIFISFPEDTPEQDLRTVGLNIARQVALDAGNSEERYAEHPYVHAVFGNFEVDLVPCFRVGSAAQIKSAVDRTPFHNIFILDRIEGLEDEVLLLKQFMKGAGVYGSDLRKGGFSGYLAELLVIHYGSFTEVLQAADGWKSGIIIDITEHGNKQHNDPLVVVDPTDPARNVAAALTLDRFAEFIDMARQYLDSPAIEQFLHNPPAPLSDMEFEKITARRGTDLLAVVFDKPDVVDDVLYPQLFMLHNSITDLLSRNGFTVLNGDVWAGDGEAAVVLEMEVSCLPPAKKHAGPPVWERSHAGKFKQKYLQNKGLSKVYIENGRYVVDVPRPYTDPVELIKSELLNCRLGKHVGACIKTGFEVRKDKGLQEIDNVDFRIFLKKFFKL
ncbi:MAG: CCA tRNA nucleotidyltransferase [ANME-2 cluster archaeon]|nr:CCA tRNA nucleotidyltransferase [ANME-2 cluster archaeon]MBC2702199.1 CCA tRNA nucleotidyltransferase [ANME-2 cluster archaeon]MBC2706931.1 CCA tRNA nucleotidyltransferase [ANME-2 cluster archaeon]MBC2748118.1 CCA tRNA nucleotidyltransferase [ANME-2 cluster archaeon]MBC2764035.1 CCA tRNA nucleotidyltransferase [ANME-2 cluster archaeon]